MFKNKKLSIEAKILKRLKEKGRRLSHQEVWEKL